MTTKDRLLAFELRAKGLTWDEIGARLSYDGSTVAKDVKRVVTTGPRKLTLPPPLEAYVAAHCGGDLAVLAHQLEVSPQWLRKVFRGRAKPSPALRANLARLTGLSGEEVFQ